MTPSLQRNRLLRHTVNNGCLDPRCEDSRLLPTPGVPGGFLILVLNQGWAQQERTRSS